MTVTYDQLQSWKPEELGTAADQLNKARKGIQDQQDEMDAGKIPDTWIGEASGRATDRHRRLITDLNDIAAPLSQVINGLDEAQATIKRLKESAKGAHDSAIGKGWKVNTSSPVTITAGDTDSEDPKGDEAAMTELAQTIEDALSQAATAESDLVAILNHATKNEYDGGTGSLAQASLPPELRGLSDEELYKRMLESPADYDGYVDALTPDQQKGLGRALADETNAITDPNDYSLYGKDGMSIDPTKVAKLNAMFDAYGEHPVVSTSFLNDLGPEGVLNLNGWVSRMQSDDNFPDDSNPYHNTMSPDLAKQIGYLQTNLGETLSAGTDGLKADGEPGTDTHVSSEWVSQLVDKGDDVMPVGYQGADGSAPYKAYGYQLMAPMLRSADSGYLLNEVGDGMLGFETKFARENGGHSPWNFPIMDDDGRIVGGYTDRFLPNGPDYNHMEGIRLDWTGGADQNDPAGFDPMGALLDGMSNNPDAARDFFDGSNVDMGDGSVRRTDYFLTDRHWPYDEVSWQDRPISEQENHGPTNSSALGNALKAATMDDTIDAGDRKQIGHLLDDIVKSTAQDDALSQDSADKSENPGSVDAIRPELRDELGDIFGYHAETMHESMSSARVLSEDGSFGPYGTTYSEGDMRRFLLDLGKDPDAYETVRHAEYAETQRQLTADLKAGKADTNLLVTEHTGGMSDVLGALDYGANKADILDTLTSDQEHNDDVSKKAGIAREIAGMIPIDKAGNVLPGAGWALDKGVGSAIDSWEKANLQDHTGETTYDMGELIEVRKSMAKSYIAEILAQNGVPESDIPGLTEGVETQYQSGYDEAHKLVNPA